LDRPVAALAQVFDISSLFDGPFFNDIQQLVYNNIWSTAASQDPFDPTIASQIQDTYQLELLGELFYIDVTSETQDPVPRQETEIDVHGVTVTQDPVLDFRQATGNPSNIFVGTIAANVSSTDDPTTDADWQRWDAISGSDGLANSVYFIETLGGQLDSLDLESVSISRSLVLHN
jgi:hypothetical protein